MTTPQQHRALFRAAIYQIFESKKNNNKKLKS
jgi:hypothetical protein